MGYGCGMGHTNQILSNRPVGGSPFADLIKNNMVGIGQNHVGAKEMFETMNRPGTGRGLFNSDLLKGILRTVR